MARTRVDHVARAVRGALGHLASPGGGRETLRSAALAGAGALRRWAHAPDPLERLEEVTLLRNLVTKEAVGVAVALGIPDLVAAGTGEIGALAEATGAHPDALGRVCRHLVARGIFAETGPGTLALNEVGELLCSDHPGGHATFFRKDAAVSRLEQALSGMLHSTMTGRPAYAAVHGEELWEQVAREPLVAASFDVEMACHARLVGPGLAERYDWDGIASVMDVGGGTGEMLRELLTRHRGMRGVVLELAGAAERAGRAIERGGLAGRMTVTESSFLDHVPPGADAYLLSWILHDWDDDEAVAILERCGAAAGPAGRVLVVEQLLDDANNTDLDLRMLVYFGGRERTRTEYEELARRAGLRPCSWTPLVAGFAVMDVRSA